MTSSELQDYIKQQRAVGKTDDEIRQALLAAGWPQETVNEATGHTSQTLPGVPMPPISGKLPSIKRLFEESLALFRARISTVVLSSLVLGAAIVGVAIIGFVIWLVAFRTIGDVSLPLILVGVIFGLVVFVGYVYALLWMGVSQVTALRDAQEHTGVMENLRRSRKYIVSSLLVKLLTVLVTMGGMILFVVPGLIFAVRYSFAPFIMIVEGKKGRAALAQSKAYTMGRFWPIVGRMFLLNAIYLGTYFAIQALTSSSNSVGVVIVRSIVLAGLQIFYSLFSLAYVYILYTHVKETAGTTQPEKYLSSVTGWAIWGGVGWLLLVVVMIGSLTLLSLNSAREKSRDAKRVADIRQLSSALDLYAIENDSIYPERLEDLVPAYIGKIPVAPLPADGDCTEEENSYVYTKLDDTEYEITFCLGKETQGHEAGPRLGTEVGIW